MLDQRIEIRLPDETKLIAVANENTDFPCISIYHSDAEENGEEVAYVEFHPDKKTGRKLIVAAYQNNDDNEKYCEPFHYLFKPAFKELFHAYVNSESNECRLVKNEGYYEVIRNSDNLVIYREFAYDNSKLHNHVGHNVTLAKYGGEDGIDNMSIECLDCNEVLYSVNRVKPLNDVFRVAQPRSLFNIISFTNDSDELPTYGCIGFSKINFGADGKGYNAEWTDKFQALKTNKFVEVYNELINGYLSCNLMKSAEDMQKYCKSSDKLLKIWDSKFVTQIVTDNYTFFVVLDPNGKNAEAQIFAYLNEFLYEYVKPLDFPVSSNIDCDAIISHVKHLNSYKNPRITYLDDVEDDCWELFKKYAEHVGVTFGEGIDRTISKEISEKIMSLVERTFGIDFPLSQGG